VARVLTPHEDWEDYGLTPDPVPTQDQLLWDHLLSGTAMAAGLQDAPPLNLPDENARPDIPLAEYVTQAWHVLEPGRPLQWGWHLDAMCEHLEAVSAGELTRLAINVSPGSTKSLGVCVFWPTWEWTYRPHMRSLFYSYSEAFSIRDAVRSRRLMQSKWYQERWGGVFRFTGDQNQKSRYENNKTGFRVTSSISGSVTGERGDRLVIDDPMKATDARNDTKLAQINTTFDEALSNRLSDQRRSAIVLIMQRLNANDLTGHLLQKGVWTLGDDARRAWVHLSIPMEYEPIEAGDAHPIPPQLDNRTKSPLGSGDPRTERGESMDPARFPADVIQELKTTQGSFGYAAQYQQRPVPAGGGMFKKAWFRFWQPAGAFLGNTVKVLLDDGTVHQAPVVTLPMVWEEELQSWDLTFDSSGSMVVGQVWARSKARAFLLAEERGAWEFTEQVAAIRRMSQAHPRASAKLIEMAANAKASASTLRDDVPGIILVSASEDKETRASVVTPFVEAGNVYLPHPDVAPWVWDWLYEVATFPQGGFNDRVDAMSMGLRRLLVSGAAARRPRQQSATFSTLGM
jgi:predicted phage terminase large subunit-like protein